MPVQYGLLATHVGPVLAKYVRHSQMCPQLDVSDKSDKKRMICTTQMKKPHKICPTELDMSDKKYLCFCVRIHHAQA